LNYVEQGPVLYRRGFQIGVARASGHGRWG
jgi:hypothetical protein